MVTPELLDYIRNQQKQGVAMDAIHDALLTSGWVKEDVEAALVQVSAPADVTVVPIAAAQPMAAQSQPLAGDSSGVNGPFPAELKRWNWGAFLLNWIWGLGNDVYISLLVFVPIVGLVMVFVLGAKGNEWAWKHRKFQSIEHFKTVQKAWVRWGVILFLVMVIVYGLGIAAIITAVNRNNASTTTSTTTIQ